MAGRAKRWMVVTGLCAAVSTLAACGPTLYMWNSIPAASTLEEARQANAAEYAPYEFFLAQSYLEKAREEAAEANYQDAIRFAERAEELGVEARDRARSRMRELGR